MSESEVESETKPAPPIVNKTIEERLAHLEEQNEGLKRVGGLMLALVVIMGVALIITSRSIGSAVDTESVILSNMSRPRAAFTAMPNGHVGMLFYNFAGLLPPSASYSTVPTLDGLVLYDQKGLPRIMLGIDERNMPVLAVLGIDGKPIYSAITQEQYQQLLEQEAATGTAGQLPGGQAPSVTGGTGSAIPAPSVPNDALPVPGEAGSAVPAPVNMPTPVATPAQ